MAAVMDQELQHSRKEQAESFWEEGYLLVRGIFDSAEVDLLTEELESLIKRWSFDTEWTGPWRRALLAPEMLRASNFKTLHDLHLYAPGWARAIGNASLVDILTALLGPDVEFHHSTMHVKPPETGQPFPMHQDWPFYPHADSRYVDVLVHLDDTGPENGELRFLRGSHRQGPLQHVTVSDGTPCTPVLPTEDYRLEETVAVPARRGDVICFNINTVHGSYLNRTDRTRRLVRVGYRHPDNVQLGGQAMNRPGVMVAGYRPRAVGVEPFTPFIDRPPTKHV